MLSPRVRTGAGIGALGLALGASALAAPPAVSATNATNATDAAASASKAAALSPTAEELRLDRSAPQEILALSGFDDVAPEFARLLGSARSAAQAHGGDYLSHEIAYRATLLRDRLGLGATLPGGHLHTPVLQFGAGNTDPATGAVTDPECVRNRLDIVAQVRAVPAVAVSASGTSGSPGRAGTPG